MLFMGECGEYELVFTIKSELKNEFLQQARDNLLSFTQLGIIRSKHIKSLHTEDENIEFKKFEIKARDFNNIEDYLSELLNYVETNRK